MIQSLAIFTIIIMLKLWCIYDHFDLRVDLDDMYAWRMIY